MRRLHLLFLVAPLSVVALLASVLITPSRAMAAGAPTQTNFKGKAAVYTDAGPYFVVSFTCSPSSATSGTLSGKWTFEDSDGTSTSGTLGSGTACALTKSHQWSTASSIGPADAPTPPSSWTVGLNGVNGSNVGTLDRLFLTDISATKTSFGTTTPHTLLPPCPSGSSPCIQIDAVVSGTTFKSEEVPGFGTLNLQLPKG
jgi:hypothetical protein